MLGSEMPTLNFYRYTHYRNTNGYVAFHNEPLDMLEQLGLESVLTTGFDDNRPFFIYHGKGEAWLDQEIPSYLFQVIEVHFEVSNKDIYLARDKNDYKSLYEFNVDHSKQIESPVFTEKGQRLINEGKRWFILINEEYGDNESFLVMPSTLVSKLVPVSDICQC